MPSLLPGFSYDIFISYRQNDNRSGSGQGWVTEFVRALTEELSATIKDPVSIYFDTNPHDGLLETHNVDKSLEGKLKCLIFIPILSQTYCDPKSFAWQHEFCAFNKLAQADSLGRDIRLSNGNVASRILPIKIHDLDPADKTLIESEIGGVLRAIEFIYREPGVNRPLKPTDSKSDNQNHTDYGNQVNKVANAVKEIIGSLKNPTLAASRPNERRAETGKNSRWHQPTSPMRKILLASVVTILTITVGYFLYKLVSTKYQQPSPSVAVLAFADLSPAKDQEWFSDGLTDEILNSLTKLGSLKVTSRTSSFYFKGKDAPIEEIAAKLGVAHVVEGSIKTINNQLRITAQLIRASDGFHLWSETYDRTTDDLFAVQADIAENIARELQQQLSTDERRLIDAERPTNPKAYTYFLKGNFFHDQYRNRFDTADFRKAEDAFIEAIRLDPEYGAAYGELANLNDTRHTHDNPVYYRRTRDSLARIAYRLSPNAITVLRVMSYCFTNREKPVLDSAFYYIQRAYAINPQDAWVNETVSDFYMFAGLPDLALPYSLASSERDPLSPTHMLTVSGTTLSLGDFVKAKRYAEKAIELDPSNPVAHFQLLWIAEIERDTTQVVHLINQIRSAPMTAIVKQQSDTASRVILLAMRGKYKEALDLKDNAYNRMEVALIKKDEEAIMTGIKEVIIDPYPAYFDLQTNPLYNPVRNRPDFQKILQEQKEIYERNKAKYARLE